MAAQPKRRTSRSKKHERRSHFALKEPAITKCPKCKQPKRSHFVCGYCGYYGKGDKKE